MSKKSILIIIGIIAVCVIVYFIVFHVPRPVMLGWEKIDDYETTMSFFAEDGTEETLHFDISVIPVRGSDDSVISTISKNNLEEILKTTKCLRILKSPPFNYEEYNVFTINAVTDKGPLHIIVGEETALWYRDGGDLFKYSILDHQTFYNRLSEASQLLEEGFSLSRLSCTKS